MQSTHNRDSALRKMAQIVEGIDIAMLTTIDAEGCLRSRPMATQRIEAGSDVIWFFTRDDSPKSDEITRDHRVNVTYSDPKHNRYVSVSGSAAVTRDEDRIRALWEPALKTWFPQGVDDPHLALVRVTVDTAEYWESSSNSMVLFAGFVRSIFKGHAQESLGHHEKLTLS